MCGGQFRRFFLSNNLFVQQFFDEAVDLVVTACESLAFLCLEHDVLNGFHLCGRACQSALLRVAVNVGH